MQMCTPAGNTWLMARAYPRLKGASDSVNPVKGMNEPVNTMVLFCRLRLAFRYLAASPIRYVPMVTTTDLAGLFSTALRMALKSVLVSCRLSFMHISENLSLTYIRSELR